MDLANAPDPTAVAARLQALERWRTGAGADPAAAQTTLGEVVEALRAVDGAMRGLVPEIKALLETIDAGTATVPAIASAIGTVITSARRCPHLKL